LFQRKKIQKNAFQILQTFSKKNFYQRKIDMTIIAENQRFNISHTIYNNSKLVNFVKHNTFRFNTK